jgi:hypothetical protein
MPTNIDAMIESLRKDVPEIDQDSLSCPELAKALGIGETKARRVINAKLSSGEWEVTRKTGDGGIFVRSYRPKKPQ